MSIIDIEWVLKEMATVKTSAAINETDKFMKY